MRSFNLIQVIKRGFIMLLLLISMQQSNAQQVIVNLILQPPFSGNLLDYSSLENRAIISLTNTTSELKEVRVIGSITNESQGLYIKTAEDYHPSMPVILAPNSTKILRANPHAVSFLDQGNVRTNATDAQQQEIIRTGLLPEGFYRVCIDIYEYNSQVLLSPPGSGCFGFDISQADPPIITYPLNGEVLPIINRNPVFSWTPPLGSLAGAQIKYDQIVVKLMPGQNPNDAIAAARDFNANNPVLFNHSIAAQTYVRQPHDLPFEPGQTYAMQVIAKDQNNNLIIRNLGRSEIITFTYGTDLHTNQNGLTFNNNVSEYFTSINLTGNLRYYYNSPNVANTYPGVNSGSGSTTTDGLPVYNGGFYNNTSGSGNQGNNGGSGGNNSRGNSTGNGLNIQTNTNPVNNNGSGNRTSGNGIQLQNNTNPLNNNGTGNSTSGNGLQLQNNTNLLNTNGSGSTGNNNAQFGYDNNSYADGLAGNSNGLQLNDGGAMEQLPDMFSGYENSPLGGLTVKLILGWQMESPADWGLEHFVNPGNIVPPHILMNSDNGADRETRTLAVSFAGANGNFGFSVPELDEIDFGWQTGRLSIVLGHHTEGPNDQMVPDMISYEGRFRRAMIIMVESAYYCDPVQFRVGVPSSGDLGTFYAQVKTFSGSVGVIDKQALAQIGDMEVMILRKQGDRPSGVPKDEGNPGNFQDNETITLSNVTYEIIQSQVTPSNGFYKGQVTFYNLVQWNCTSAKDRYFIYTRIKDKYETNVSYVEFAPAEFRYFYHSDYTYASQTNTWNASNINRCQYDTIVGQKYGALPTYEAEFIFKPLDFYNFIQLQKAKPRLYTTVRNSQASVSGSDNNRAEGEVSWKLWKVTRNGMQDLKAEFGLDWGRTIANTGPVGINWIHAVYEDDVILEYSGTTANDGRIDRDQLSSQWDDAAQVGYYRFLEVKKDGFKGQVLRAIAQAPNSASGDIGFIPFGTAHRINDIELLPVGVAYIHLHNERDQNVQAQAVFYIDESIGQQGISNPTNSEGGVLVSCPTGSVRLVVVPSDLNKYEADTVTINVSQPHGFSDIETIEVLVKFKLHRLHFIVKDANDHSRQIVKASVKLMNSNAVMYPDIKSPFIPYEEAMTPPADDIMQGSNTNNGQVGNGLQTIQSNTPEMTVINEYLRKTNNGGGVDFAFNSSADIFEFKIYSPEGKEYITRTRMVYDEAGGGWRTIVVYMDMGRIIKGTVKLGQSPVAAATVMDITEQYQVTTNDSGYYEIHNVPKTDMLFMAFKSGYIGAEYDEANHGQAANGMYMDNSGNSIEVINENAAPVNNTNVIGNGGMDLSSLQADQNAIVKKTINFKLTTYDLLDLTKLLGFTLEVTKLTEGTPVKIKGFVTISDDQNSVFKITEETSEEGQINRKMNFGEISVMADNKINQYGIPFTRPVTIPAATTKNRLNVEMYDYQALLIDSVNGLTLNKFQDIKGSVNGLVNITLNSFSDNNFDLNDDQRIYLRDFQNGSQTMKFPVFGSDGRSPYTNAGDFGIVNQSGNPLQYKIFGFEASAQLSGSYISKDSLVLNTRIHTNLENCTPADLNILIGKIALVNGELNNRTFNSNFTIDLEQFKLKADQVTLNDGGFKFGGVLEASGMNINYSNASLLPTRFEIPDNSLQADNVKLIGVVPVEVLTGVSFGYDVNYQGGHWVLAIDGGSPSAKINAGNFAGFSGNESIALASVYLYSNGGQSVNMQNGGNYLLRLENIVNFTLSSILLTNSSIKLVGNLDTGIPNFLSYTTAKAYSLENGVLTGGALENFQVNPVEVNGIIMKFANNNSSSFTISPGNLVIRGNVNDVDPNLFQNINFTLTKTNQDTRLVINEAEHQKMRLGGTPGNGRMEAANLAGEMAVANNAWNYLYIDGDLPRDKGFSEGKRRMRFDIRGGLEVNNQSVAIDNVETPFGNITMRYDAAYQRISGNLEFAAEIKNGPSLTGHVAIVMDRLGFYFVCGGTMASSNPHAEGSAFILIGDYTQKTGEMAEILKQHSHYYDVLGKLPRGYTNADDIKGFFIEGSANIPVPIIPNFDINLVVVSAELHINVGGDVRFGMNFSDVNMYNVGMGVFVDAEFGIGASAVVACMGVNLHVLAGVDFDGTYWSSNNFEIIATGYITLEGSAYYGAGLYCDAECDGLCISDNASGSVGLIIQGKINNFDADYEIVFDAAGNTFSESD